MSAVSGHVWLREGKRGATWYAKYRLDGRQVQRRLGPAWAERGRPPAGHHTRRTARAALEALLTDARRGVLDGQRRSGATFGEAVEEWLRYVEHDRGRRRSTVRDYRLTAAAALLPAFGAETPLERVTQDAVESYRARLVAEGRLSPRTMNKHLTMLHGIFRRAQRAFGLAVNPAAGVEKQPLRRSGDFRVLDPDEVRLLASAAETGEEAALYVTAAFTGLRMGELRALAWGDVDFARSLVHVRRSWSGGELTAPKSGLVRGVPLSDEVARALDRVSRRERFVGEGDLVFPNGVGGHLDESRMRKRFRAALARAGLRPMRFHDLRHTFGTLGAQAWPLSTLRAYMGHADVSTTMVYVHHVPQHDAAARLDAVVGARAFEVEAARGLG